MSINEKLLYEFIRNKIREHRIALDLPQQKIAEELGISRTSITNIEAGTQRPPVHLLYSLCEVLGLEIREVLPPLSDVQINDDELVEVYGDVAKLPPKAASLARDLAQRLTEGQDE